MKKICVIFIGILLFACKHEDKKGISFHDNSGLFVHDNFRGEPDSLGIILEIPLEIPAFSKGGYFSGDGGGQGFLPGNRNHFWLFDSDYNVLNKPNYGENPPFYLLKSPAGAHGTFVVFKLTDGDYLCLLPLAGTHSLSWIEFESGKQPLLKIGNLGTDPVDAAVPVISWAKSKNLYEASYITWKNVLEGDIPGISTTWRDNKDYPEPFKYLGWCTWEEFKRDINDSLLVSSIQKIKKSPVPVRFALIDDGHEWTAPGIGKLKSFVPDPRKFPRGWLPVADLKSDADIRWLGLWHHQSGYFNGLAEENQFGDLNQQLTSLVSGLYLPKPEMESIDVFYRQLFGSSREAGFDFNKIDFQSTNLKHYIGEANAVQAHHWVAQAMERNIQSQGLDLLNCIAQDMVSISNTKYSSVTRCSQDYRMGNISNARIHIYQSYNNLLWMGHTVFGDHDMFHSSDTVCGRLMAVSKAMSAGPVYLSDHPDEFIPEYITPICYGDGEIIRPIAPALPLPESVFNNPMHNKTAYRVIAPQPNKAASVVCYNLFEANRDVTVTANVSTDDYQHASALIQPYPGEWHLPDEGLILYDWYEQEIIPGGKPRFELTGFSDKLVHLYPVKEGVAVIGRTDKYMSPATVGNIIIANNRITFTIKESGPFGLYIHKGEPKAENVNFEKHNHGLWKAKMEGGLKNLKIVIDIE